MAQRPAGWVAQAEHAATCVPDCFRADPCAVQVFLNGGRTFWGVEGMKAASFPYGQGGVAEINACVAEMPPRLGDPDVGITPQRWAKFIADLNATFERLPPDPLVGAITLRLVNDDDWKAAVEAHLATTFSAGGAGIASVSFEEAYWTEVAPVPADAPPEGPETGFRDPVTQPRTMPVVSVRLCYATHAAYQRAVAAQAAAEAAPAASKAAQHSHHRHRAPPRCSLLPWERHWELLPPQRAFGHAASFHAG